MATPFIFGNLLKFGLDSCHNTKGRPTFLHQERERAPKPPREPRHTNYTCAHPIIQEKGLPTGPRARESVATASGRIKAHDSSSGFSATVFSRPGVDSFSTIYFILFLKRGKKKRKRKKEKQSITHTSKCKSTSNWHW